MKTKKYPELKKRETRIRWGVQEDMVSPQNATIAEAEVAELADSVELDLGLDNEDC